LNALISKTFYLLPSEINVSPELFDLNVLDKVVYGNEDEIMIDFKTKASLESDEIMDLSPESNEVELENNLNNDLGWNNVDSEETKLIPNESQDLDNQADISPKINLIHPTRIDVHPIEIINSSDKFEISFDEVFEEETEVKLKKSEKIN
jgi:hypothetical protein